MVKERSNPRILIVTQNWLGDVLFLTPAIRAIRKKYPSAYVACLTPHRCYFALANNPHINEVIGYNDSASLFSFSSLRVIHRLRSQHFDQAILFHDSKTKAILTRLAGIPERIGYQKLGGKRRPLTRAISKPTLPMHKTKVFLHLLNAIGVPADGMTPDFFPFLKAGEELDALFQSFGLSRQLPYVVVHAGGNWDLKRWPADSFREWMRLFLEKYDFPIVLCGSENEKKLIKKISAGLDPNQVFSVCGQTTLDMLAVLLKHAKLVVSNDSGPIHLAASQGAPLLGIFGPTSPDLTGPLSKGPMKILRKDPGCEIPCYFSSCDTRVCMEWITPEEVFAASQTLLNDK